MMKRDVYYGTAAATIAAAFALLATVATRNLYLGSFPLLATVVSLGLLLAGVWAYFGAKEAEAAANAAMGEMGGEEGALPPHMMGDPQMSALAGKVPAVHRLLMIMADVDESIVPVYDKFETDDEGALVGYGFRSMKPGLLSTESMKNRIYERLSTAFGEGWNIGFDSETDEIEGSKKSAIPSLVAPPLWPVARTPEEAAEWVPQKPIHLGVGESGPLQVNLAESPHMFVVGSTGGGKSVSVRAMLMERLAYGHRVFIADGKGTDYAPFREYPNVSAVSTDLEQHVALIHMVWQLLESRRAMGQRMADRGDMSWRDTMYPVTLIVDEWASVRSNMATKFAKELKLIDRDIAEILKVGREFRVFFVLSSQGTEAKTTPSDWFAQLQTVCSLGRPDNMTINKAFPEQEQGEVRRIGQQITRKTRGRALVTISDDDGNMTTKLYQSYYSQSPGDPLNDKTPGPIVGQWQQFQSQVTQAIRQFYPRMWFQIEYPEPTDGKDPYAEKRDDGWVDLRELSVADLHRLKPVELQTKETFEPILDNLIYDPRSSGYIGNAPVGADDSAVFDI